MGKVNKRYNLETVMKAIEDVHVNGFSLRSTSNKYGISRETLRSQISKYKNGIKLNLTPGPSPVLREDEEKQLLLWMIECGKRGFGLQRSDIAKCVQNFLNANGRKTVFRDNQPQRRWFHQFTNRHPQLKAFPKITKSDFKFWFELIDEHIFKDNEQMKDIVNHSERIFLAEEIRFSLNPNGLNISAAAPMTPESSEDDDQNKFISILLNFNAAGEAGPPQIVYPLEEIPNEITETIPTAWGVGKNRSGLIDVDLFYSYIENVFVPYLAQYQVQLPVILLVNPELTPISWKLFDLCQKHQIVLIGLYPLATGILGRCRVTAFNILENWINCHPYEEFRMDQLTAIVNLFFEHTTTLSWGLVEEFRFCGLFPWNPELVDERHLTSCDQQNKVSKLKLPPPNHHHLHHQQHHHHHQQQQQQSSSSLNQADTIAAVNSITQHHHYHQPNHNNQSELQFPFDQSERTFSNKQQQHQQPRQTSTSSIAVGTDDSGPTMTYSQFCEIVGQTLVDHCERTSASREFDLGRDNLIILRKLTNFFRPHQSILKPPQPSLLSSSSQQQNSLSMDLSNDSLNSMNGLNDTNSELCLLNFLMTKRRPPLRPVVTSGSTVPPASTLADLTDQQRASSGLTTTPTIVMASVNNSNNNHHQHPHQSHSQHHHHSDHHQNQNSGNSNNLTTTIIPNDINEPHCNLELSISSYYQ